MLKFWKQIVASIIAAGIFQWAADWLFTKHALSSTIYEVLYFPGWWIAVSLIRPNDIHGGSSILVPSFALNVLLDALLVFSIIKLGRKLVSKMQK
jgi:hypothetical protein